MNKIDWIDDYQEKFGTHPLISSLKKSGFHGKLVINFGGGVPHTSHLEMCVRAYTYSTVDGEDTFSTVSGSGVKKD